MRRMGSGCVAAVMAALCGSCGTGPIEDAATNAEGTIGDVSQAIVLPSKVRPTTLTNATPQDCRFSWAGTDRDLRNEGAPVKSVMGRLNVQNPTVKISSGGEVGAHSLAEVMAVDPNVSNIVEIGWNVYDNDPTPRLFVFYWVNGQPKCNLSGVPHYRCDAFVSTSSTIRQDMALTVGSQVTLAMNHVDSGTTRGWHFLYNGTDFGYLPDSLWSNTFTSVAGGKWFGEVAGSCTARCSSMGNGRFASDSAAATFASMQYTVQGQAPTEAVFNAGLIQTEPAKYTASWVTGFRAPLRYGGPYPGGPNCPTLPPPPCPKVKSCCGGTVWVCQTQSCPIVCPPPEG